MKSSIRAIVGQYFAISVVIAFLLFSFVALKVKNMSLKHDNITLKNEIDAVKNRNTHLSAENQTLCSKQIVVTSALQDLKMVKSKEEPVKIEVSKKMIDKLDNFLKKQ